MYYKNGRFLPPFFFNKLPDSLESNVFDSRFISFSFVYYINIKTTIMSKRKRTWVRPCEYAKKKKVTLQVVNNWIKRGKLLRRYNENKTPLVSEAA